MLSSSHHHCKRQPGPFWELNPGRRQKTSIYTCAAHDVNLGCALFLRSAQRARSESDRGAPCDPTSPQSYSGEAPPEEAMRPRLHEGVVRARQDVLSLALRSSEGSELRGSGQRGGVKPRPSDGRFRLATQAVNSLAHFSLAHQWVPPGTRALGSVGGACCFTA